MTTNVYMTVYYMSIGFSIFEDLTFESIPKAMELIRSHTNETFEVDKVKIPKSLYCQLLLACKEFELDFDSFVSACISIGKADDSPFLFY